VKIVQSSPFNHRCFAQFAGLVFVQFILFCSAFYFFFTFNLICGINTRQQQLLTKQLNKEEALL